MTNEQAIQILSDVCGVFKGTLAEHNQIQLALSKARAALTPIEKPAKK